jgi:hypothetical protein
MTLMLTLARAVTLLTGWNSAAGGDGGDAVAARRISGPIIAGTIMPCGGDGYQPVYYCSKMDRSRGLWKSVASDGSLC